MKGFFDDAVPSGHSVLVIESGSQHILARASNGLRQAFPEARLSLLTCWPDTPPGPFARVMQARDYPGTGAKLRLLASFRKQPSDVLAVVCSKEPIMYSWKMMALLIVPAKTLIINENGDFFWLDWNNRRTLRSFLQSRWVIIRKEFLLTVLRALAFPFTVLYLLATAAWLYARRWRRLLWWRIRGAPS
jgi:hypothetical protein